MALFFNFCPSKWPGQEEMRGMNGPTIVLLIWETSRNAAYSIPLSLATAGRASKAQLSSVAFMLDITSKNSSGYALWWNLSSSCGCHECFPISYTSPGPHMTLLTPSPSATAMTHVSNPKRWAGGSHVSRTGLSVPLPFSPSTACYCSCLSWTLYSPGTLSLAFTLLSHW